MKKNLISKKYIKKSKVSKKYTKIQHGGSFDSDVKILKENIEALEYIQAHFNDGKDINGNLINFDAPVHNVCKTLVSIPLDKDTDRTKMQFKTFSSLIEDFKNWAKTLSKDITWNNAIEKANILLSSKISNLRSSMATLTRLNNNITNSFQKSLSRYRSNEKEKERKKEQELKEKKELQNMTNTYNMVTSNNLSNYTPPKQPKKSILKSMLSLFKR
jgi:hypothetical protein